MCVSPRSVAAFSLSEEAAAFEFDCPQVVVQVGRADGRALSEICSRA